MPNIREEYDVVVVGAGHAGCEAALAAARMGLETIIFTVSVESIAMMPCNIFLTLQLLAFSCSHEAKQKDRKGRLQMQ